MLILQAQLADPRLNLRAGLPLVFDGLVAAHVNELTRKQFEHLGQHILKKENRLLVRVEYVGVDAPTRPDIELFARDAELRIRRNRRLSVAGHLDFRDDGDVSLTRVFDNFADLILRVKAAVRLFVEALWILSLV